MNSLAKKLFVAIFFTLSTTFSYAQPENVVIQEYFDELKANRYNPKLAPDGYDGPGTAIKVIVSMHLLDVHKVDDNNMDYRASFYIRQYWNDSRLAYLHMDISEIILHDLSLVWHPHIYFEQAKEGMMHDVVNPNVFMRIRRTGEVQYSMKISVTFSCPMNFQNFPHDTQKCEFRIDTYGRRRDELELNWSTPNDSFSVAKRINILPFDLVAFNSQTINEDEPYGKYRSLIVNLTFKRYQGFFMMRLFIPYIILVALSWLSFWIKPKMRTFRISLLFVILFMMVNIASNLSSNIPPTPYAKASDIWIATCESLVFAAFLEFIFVGILHDREKEKVCHSRDSETPILPDLKEQGKSVNPDKNGTSVRMRASRLTESDTVPRRVDVLAKILFPVLFTIFNLIYWMVYSL